jgi:nitrite reductase/ring-hydroxylating ferredoxin subunit
MSKPWALSHTEAEASVEIRGWVRGAPSSAVGHRRVFVWRAPTEGPGSTLPALVLLWRTRSGTAVATDARCPHRQYLMRDALIRGDAIECPLHGHHFDRDGRCVNRPATPAARLLEICEADGYVWLAEPREA